VEITRRTALEFLGQGLLAAGSGWSVSIARDNGRSISLGVLSPNLVSAIHSIAKRTGAYERKGLTIVERPIPSGESAAGIEELIRGNLDVFIGAGAEVARANSIYIDGKKSPPLVVIQGGTAGASSLVLRGDWRGKSFDDLKSKPLKIAVSSPSSIHLALFRGYLLERYATTTDLAWQFLNMEGGNMAPMLRAKQMDGFLHSEPATTLAITADAGFVFMSAKRGDMGTRARTIPVTFTSANRSWLMKNQDTANRFVAALSDANISFATMPKAQMVDMIAEWAKVPAAIVSQAYDRLDPRMTMTLEGAQAFESAEKLAIGSSLRMSSLRIIFLVKNPPRQKEPREVSQDLPDEQGCRDT
jgi:ABC-type nitrate/sulfonate/bicarbonate transport system substrate-binding protein